MLQIWSHFWNMISNGCLAIVYFVEIIWCVKLTSKANPPEIVRKSAETCAELIPSKSSKSGERYQKQFSHFCKWKSENNVKKITYGRGYAGWPIF
jgi:hypothetical protein